MSVLITLFVSGYLQSHLSDRSLTQFVCQRGLLLFFLLQSSQIGFLRQRFSACQHLQTVMPRWIIFSAIHLPGWVLLCCRGSDGKCYQMSSTVIVQYTCTVFDVCLPSQPTQYCENSRVTKLGIINTLYNSVLRTVFCKLWPATDRPLLGFRMTWG